MCIRHRIKDLRNTVINFDAAVIDFDNTSMIIQKKSTILTILSLLFMQKSLILTIQSWFSNRNCQSWQRCSDIMQRSLIFIILQNLSLEPCCYDIEKNLLPTIPSLSQQKSCILIIMQWFSNTSQCKHNDRMVTTRSKCIRTWAVK